MVSKIIQKEKERQREYLNGCGIDYSYTPSSPDFRAICRLGDKHLSYCDGCYSYQIAHKQSLINLKEYLEEELEWTDDSIQYRVETKEARFSSKEETIKLNKYSSGKEKQLKEDIKELTEMIKKYGN